MATQSATRVVAPAGVLSALRSQTRSASTDDAAAPTGNLAAWGNNTSGQLGTLPVQYGGDGKGSDSVYESVATAPGASQVVGGSPGFLALYPDGSVTAWGGSSDGLGLGPSTGGKPAVPSRVPVATVTGVSSTGGDTLFVTSAGFVYGVGYDNDAELGPNAGLSEVDLRGVGFGLQETVVQIPIGADGLAVLKSVTAGPGTSYAVDSDGHVYAWGKNLNGEWGNGVESGLDTTPGEYGYDPDPTPTLIPGLSDVTAITAFYGGAYALKSDGTVWEWGTVTGSLSPVQVPGLTDVKSIAKGDGGYYGNYPMAIKNDGTVWTAPFGQSAQQVSGIANAVSVAESGSNYAVYGAAQLTNGQVWSWNDGSYGANTYGTLGNGTTSLSPSATPVRVQGITGAVSVASGGASQAAVAAVPTPPGGPLTLKEMPGGSNPSEICVACAEAQRGDPVNTATGRLSESYDDLSISGRGPALDLNRTYNSATAGQDSLFGFGWSTDYGMNLTVGDAGVVTVTQENASQVAFTPTGSGYSAPSRVQATLTHNGDGTWTMLRRAQSTFTFDLQGRLIAITDLNGLRTTVTYPSSSAMVIADPAGRKFTLALAGGHVSTLTDSSSPARVVRYAYDTAGNLIQVTDAVGGVTTFGYDGAHQLTQVTAPNNQASGASTRNVFDSAGRVTQQADPLNRITQWTYSPQSDGGLITDTIDPAGHVTVDRYDAFGLRSSQTVASGTAASATTTYQYDMDTLGVTAECDALGHCTTREYDSSGNVTSSTDPLGHTTHYAYNGLNELTLTITPMGFRTTRTYDGAGNLLTVSQPVIDSGGAQTGTRLTKYGYGGTSPSHPGDVTSMTDANGNTWQYRYDAYGDRVSETAPATAENSAGDKTTYGYSTGRGVQTSMIAPKGNLPGAASGSYRTTYAYDALNRLTTTSDPLWSTTAATLHRTLDTYDGDGNIIRERGPDGKTTTWTFDAADQPVKTVQPGSATVTETYTPDGQLATRTDPDLHSTTYAYDAAGQNTSTTDPLGRKRCNQFDAAGELLAHWTAPADCGTPGTTATNYLYDPAGEPTNMYLGDGSSNAEFTYDADGRRTEADGNTGQWTYAYDSVGEQTSAQNGAGDTVTHAYDLEGNATSIGYPNAGSINESYDAQDRATSLTDWLGNTSAFAYDANSNLQTTTLPPSTGEADNYTYDQTDSLLGAADSQGTSNLASFTYTRDGASRVATSATTGPAEPNQAFTYTANRAVATSGPAATPTPYTYDPAQQLTSMAAGSKMAYDTAGQLCWSAPISTSAKCTSKTPTGATKFAYDAAGNRVSRTPATGAATTYTYTYDSADRLTGATATGLAASYVYDGDGLRFSKTVGGVTTDWDWDTTTGIPEILSDGIHQFIYGPDGSPLEQVASDGTVNYLHHDQIGSTRLLTSTTGTTVGTATYAPYGATTSTTGTITPLGFAGQYNDAETGLIYMRAREYDPTTGQFLSVDPLIDLTQQAYQYTAGDPENATDPSGDIIDIDGLDPEDLPGLPKPAEWDDGSPVDPSNTEPSDSKPTPNYPVNPEYDYNGKCQDQPRHIARVGDRAEANRNAEKLTRSIRQAKGSDPDNPSSSSASKLERIVYLLGRLFHGQ